jgi:hypothetical protein
MTADAPMTKGCRSTPFILTAPCSSFDPASLEAFGLLNDSDDSDLVSGPSVAGWTGRARP